MAKRPTVPFELHASVRLRANYEIDVGAEIALSPDGRTVAIVRGEWQARRLELLDLAGGGVIEAIPEAPGQSLQHLAWSRDSERWAVSDLRYEDNVQRGIVHVGEARSGGAHVSAATQRYGVVTCNALARASSVLTFAPDGRSIVMRAYGRDGDAALTHISVPDGEVREQALGEGECDLYAQAYTADGTLYTLTAEAGDSGGLAWYRGGATSPAGRLPWAFGCALVETRRGLWALGVPRYCFRIVDGVAGALLPCLDPPRRERVQRLRDRANAQWDKAYLDDLLRRIDEGGSNVTYRLTPTSLSVAPEPEVATGMRGFENELLWETSYAGPLGDDDVAVSDGVAVWRWRDAGETLSRTLLLDDTKRCTHRGARIIGLSSAGDTLALLWKKDARGAKTVLSVFDVG